MNKLLMVLKTFVCVESWDTYKGKIINSYIFLVENLQILKFANFSYLYLSNKFKQNYNL